MQNLHATNGSLALDGYGSIPFKGMSVAPGTVVGGKYCLLGMLGKGGMGAVYAARHVSLDAVFAIKFLTPGALEQDEAQARFKHEARAAATLTNEHVAKVLDVGVHEDELYIVMEHLEGTDLGALAKARGVIPWDEAAYYIAQACSALEEAHEHGIIHRDVKLANLFITQRVGMPFLKVLDFGIAKTIGVGDVTRTAAMLGSPKYMSPEQMNDPRSVDGRTDIWSLGVVLYRLVTGQMPFDGETLGRICMLIVNERPTPIPTLRPDVPPELVAIIDRCLDKDRDRRFQTVGELGAALAPFASYTPPAHASADRLSHPASHERVVVRSSHPSSDAGYDMSSTESSSATQLSASPPPLHPPPRFALAAAAGIVISLAIVGPTMWWRAHAKATARDEASASPASDPPAAVTVVADFPADPPPPGPAGPTELPAATTVPSAAAMPQPVAVAPSPAIRRTPAPVRPSPEPSRSSRRRGFELPDDRR